MEARLRKRSGKKVTKPEIRRGKGELSQKGSGKNAKRSGKSSGKRCVHKRNQKNKVFRKGQCTIPRRYGLILNDYIYAPPISSSSPPFFSPTNLPRLLTLRSKSKSKSKRTDSWGCGCGMVRRYVGFSFRCHTPTHTILLLL